jgi:hypothetical protein
MRSISSETQQSFDQYWGCGIILMWLKFRECMKSHINTDGSYCVLQKKYSSCSRCSSSENRSRAASFSFPDPEPHHHWWKLRFASKEMLFCRELVWPSFELAPTISYNGGPGPGHSHLHGRPERSRPTGSRDMCMEFIFYSCICQSCTDLQLIKGWQFDFL